MRKWTILLFPLIMIFILFSYGFKPVIATVPEALRVNGPTEVLYPKNKTIPKKNIAVPPFLLTSYNGFKEALAIKES